MTTTVHGSAIELRKNNRKYFYIFLWIQISQAIYGVIYTIYVMTQVKFDDMGLKALFLILSLMGEIFFTLMLTSLLMFHTYLMVNNLTTWETLSWNKISHMKIWPRKYGSPFDGGIRENIRQYFNPGQGNNFIQWKMPRALPSIEEGEKIIERRKYSYLFEKIFIKCQ